MRHMKQKLKLYSMATPNGQKVGIALEEMEIPYEAYLIDITQGDQFKPEFLAINPNSKIPALVDPNTLDRGAPLCMMESGAILIYLAELSGRFLPVDPVEKSQVLQWLFFQVGGVGPMFGQFGHFYKFAKNQCDHPYPVERYKKEVLRLLAVMEKQLQDHPFIAGEQLSIADFSLVPWVNGLSEFYRAGETLRLSDFRRVLEWSSEILKRPKTKIGMKVCSL